MKTGEQNFLLPLFSAHLGEEERLQCRSKKALFWAFYFFFKQCMKRRRFRQNTPFHLNKKAAKCVRVHIGPPFVICSIASLIAILIVKINSITSLPNLNNDPEVGRLFHFGPWS